MSINEQSRPIRPYHDTLVNLVLAGLFAAISYVVFVFLRVDINIGVTKTSFHAANTLVVLAPLLIAAPYGLLGPAIGLFLADMFSGYAHVAPETLILKIVMAAVCYCSFKALSRNTPTESTRHYLNAAIAMIAGLVTNAILAPVSSYFYHTYLLGSATSPAKIFVKISAGVTWFNAVLSAILGAVIYVALYKALKHSHLKHFFH